MSSDDGVYAHHRHRVRDAEHVVIVLGAQHKLLLGSVVSLLPFKGGVGAMKLGDEGAVLLAIVFNHKGVIQ